MASYREPSGDCAIALVYSTALRSQRIGKGNHAMRLTDVDLLLFQVDTLVLAGEDRRGH